MLHVVEKHDNHWTTSQLLTGSPVVISSLIVQRLLCFSTDHQPSSTVPHHAEVFHNTVARRICYFRGISVLCFVVIKMPRRENVRQLHTRRYATFGCLWDPRRGSLLRHSVVQYCEVQRGNKCNPGKTHADRRYQCGGGADGPLLCWSAVIIVLAGATRCRHVTVRERSKDPSYQKTLNLPEGRISNVFHKQVICILRATHDAHFIDNKGEGLDARCHDSRHCQSTLVPLATRIRAFGPNSQKGRYKKDSCCSVVYHLLDVV